MAILNWRIKVIHYQENRRYVLPAVFYFHYICLPMQKLTINIVAFDIPYPAIYGGTIDIFYKLRTLKKTGVNIILHCFEYNKPKQQELEKYCKQVFYYQRKKGVRYIFSKLPYIVITRSNRDLIENLKANNNPILFEGLHSCFFLNSEVLPCHLCNV